jgi:hypothetical protein
MAPLSFLKSRHWGRKELHTRMLVLGGRVADRLSPIAARKMQAGHPLDCGAVSDYRS